MAARRSSANRIPPHNLDAEAALLGAALIEPRAAGVVATLDAAEFYKPAHRHLAYAMATLLQRAEPVDTVTVAEELRRTGLLEDIGGPQVLLALQAVTPSLSRADHYAARVRDLAQRRSLMAVAAELIDSAYAEEVPTVELLAAARRRLDTLERIEPATTDLAALVGALVAGLDDGPFPSMLRRDDGQDIICAASVVSLYGEGGSGKTLLALELARQCLEAGRAVLWADYEMTAATIVKHLLRIGAHAEAVAEHFVYERGLPPGWLSPAFLARRRPAAVVVDSMAAALAARGLDENANADVETWTANVARTFVAVDDAPVVVVIDHTGHGNGGHARGASRKLQAVDMSLELASREAFSRTSSGWSELLCRKDRFGTWAAGDALAAVRYVPADNGASLTVTLAAPETIGQWRPTRAMEAVSRYVEIHPDCSRKDLEEAVRGYRATVVRDATNRLVAEGYMTRDKGARGAFIHRSITSFRADEPTPRDADDAY